MTKCTNPNKILLFLIIILASSCKKIVDAGNPKTMLQTATVFSNKDAALSAVAGYYQKLVWNSGWIMNGGVTLYAGLSADEIKNVYPDEESERFLNNELLENDDFGISGNLWEAAYKNIYHVNSVLEGLEISKKIDAGLKSQLRGEMLLGRALQYFYLINLFGDVPLVLSTNYEENQYLSRTTVGDIYAQITIDVKEASTLMSNEYPSSGRVRPNRYAALALLARIYLYQQDWQAAFNVADEIIGRTDLYHLTNIEDVFTKNSTEAIWQIEPIAGGFMNTGEGFMFNPFDEWSVPMYSVTNTLVSSFHDKDLRKTWLGANEASGETIYYPSKYKIGVSTEILENYVIIRLAELYLIRSEAAAHLDNIESGLVDLNTIRERAGLDGLSITNAEALLNALMEERRLELFCEWGHRWLDLKRSGKANAILQEYKSPNWQPTDVLYPIPRRQRLLNPFLEQNPGY